MEKPENVVAVKNAIRFALGAEKREFAEFPQVVVTGDEVIFTWFRGEDKMEALFARDGYVTWVFRIGGNIWPYGGVERDGNSGRFWRDVACFLAGEYGRLREGDADALGFGYLSG